MERKAQTIDTPNGPHAAPFDPSFEDRLADCNSKEDLFMLVRRNGYVDPDALAEVEARGLLGAYYEWKQQASDEQ